MVLIRLVDVCFSGVFSDPHCKYTMPEGGSGFNHISGHDFQMGVLRSSLTIGIQAHSGFNQISGHDFQKGVLRSSLTIGIQAHSGFNQIGGHDFQKGVLRSSL